MNNRVYNSWPILLGEFFNPEHKYIKDDLIKYFYDYKKLNPNINPVKGEAAPSNLYRSQYDLHTHKNPSYLKLLTFFSKCFIEMSNRSNYQYIEQDKVKPNFNVNIQSSWFIIYEKGGFVLPHHHGNCSWCCVYYLQCDKNITADNGSTYIMRPYLSQTSKDFGGKVHGEGAKYFKPEEGKMLVWPNFLYHGSTPYYGNNKRIIVSANSQIMKI